MGRVFKPTRKTEDGATVVYGDWYIEYQGADKKTHREKIGASKAIANAALAAAEERESRRRGGLPDLAAPVAVAPRPLAGLIAEYLGVLAGRGHSEGYRKLADDYLTRLAVECRWHTWADVSPDTLTVYLGERREEFDLGPATLNSYQRVAKAFANWAARKFEVRSPLDSLAPYAEEVDRRRSVRILTDPEFAALIIAAEQAPRRFNTSVPGKDRAVLYRVAGFTGLRAGELATLTPSHFDLDSAVPLVTVAAADSKGKREEPIPLPAHLADLLREFVAGREADALLWPGEWARHRHQVAWIAADATRAGIPDAADKRRPERRVTFHGLKRRFVTRLIESGAKVHEVRRLARHKDAKTTLDYYAKTDLAGLGVVANRLPAVG